MCIESSIFLLFSELRMAVVLSDLRQHLEGQLAAKKTALVETEESLRFVSRIQLYSLLPLLILPCYVAGSMWETAQWTTSRGAGGS